MLSAPHSRSRLPYHGQAQASGKLLRRIEVLVCLVTVVAQLALAVVHSWEVALEAVEAPVLLAPQPSSTDTSREPGLTTAPTVSPRRAHDALLCAVCQLVSQVKHGCALAHVGVVLAQTSCPLLSDALAHNPGLDLAIAAPRAPPHCLL